MLRALLATTLLLALPLCAQALQITDDRGVTVTLQKAPLRIVSLLPSLSETVCALGACERLVAVDRYSNYPARLRKLPQAGGGLDPNIEAVVAARPDVVLLATSSRASERLQALGLTVVALEPRTHGEMRAVVRRLGELLQVGDAAELWQGIDAKMREAATSLPPSAKLLKVFFPVSNAPHAAGEASFIGETLQRLGVRNIVPSSLGVFPKLNPEFVVLANPDIIMVSEGNLLALARLPGWKHIRAVRERRICRFGADEADVLVRPGPRMGEAAQLLARCLIDKGAAAPGRTP